MLVIPLPTRDLQELRILITDHPGEASAAGVPAVTPDLAAVLRQRWAGARYAEQQGERASPGGPPAAGPADDDVPF